MYPAKFDYVRAESVEQAISLLQENPDAKLLAGGHSLLPMMKLRLAQPSMLIDIGRISGLKGISNGGGSYKIGALTTHSEVESGSGLPGALKEAASWIGDPQVRNRGTVGGNIAHADPASDLPTVFTALNATIHLTGAGGSRSVSASDYFTGLFETAMGEEELVTAVEIPDEGSNAGSCYAKLFNPASRYAMVGVAAAMGISDGVVSWCRVAAGSLVPAATRCPSVEAAMVGKAPTDENIAAAAALIGNDLSDVMGDIHASAEYRSAVAPEFAVRALKGASGRCGG